MCALGVWSCTEVPILAIGCLAHGRIQCPEHSNSCCHFCHGASKNRFKYIVRSYVPTYIKLYSNIFRSVDQENVWARLRTSFGRGTGVNHQTGPARAFTVSWKEEILAGWCAHHSAFIRVCIYIGVILQYFQWCIAIQLDSTAFGHLVQIYYVVNPPPSRKYLASAECTNLVAYLERMKAEFWPDWDRAVTQLSMSSEWKPQQNSS